MGLLRQVARNVIIKLPCYIHRRDYASQRHSAQGRGEISAIEETGARFIVVSVAIKAPCAVLAVTRPAKRV
jgi:hypothetical protein